MDNIYIPESAMAIVAHPDDIEFACAATLARWAKAGTRISFVLCTSGDVGIDEPGMTREQATKIREADRVTQQRSWVQRKLFSCTNRMAAPRL